MVFQNLASLKEAVGTTVEGNEWLVISQDMVNDFANATKDFQWIHVDPERARKESPFGGPIAHGFLSLSLVPKFIGDMIHVESAKMGVNYGLNKVRFPNPVLVGSAVKATITIKEVADYANNGAMITWNCVIHILGVEKPACIAEMVSLTFE